MVKDSGKGWEYALIENRIGINSKKIKYIKLSGEFTDNSAPKLEITE